MSPVKLQSASFHWATPNRVESEEEGPSPREEASDALII